MKKILLFISAFIVSGLIVIGTIWGLEKAGKITYVRENNAELKAINTDELFRLLIPDEGEKAGRWEIWEKLGDRIKWDSLSMHTNVWKGKCVLSAQFSKTLYEALDSIDNEESRLIKQYHYPIPMKLREKLVPCEWEVYLTGRGSEYLGFSVFTTDECYPWSNWREGQKIAGAFLSLGMEDWGKAGNYIEKEKKEILAQLKGKMPIYLQDYTGKGTGIACRFKSWVE